MTRFKGENQIVKFRRIAERLASKISSYEDVSGIVLLGGLARGFADRFSDLDIAVFLSKGNEPLRRQIHQSALDEEKRSGIGIDILVYSLGDLESQHWGETKKWMFSEAKITYDPRGEIKKVFADKLAVPKDFWLKRIAVCAEYLKWYSCPAEGDSTMSEAWIERGDLEAAHYCLNYSVEVPLRMIYALNREFVPAPKWRTFHSYELKWLPRDYREHIKEAMTVKYFSIKDFERRLKAIRGMWLEIVPKIKD